MTLGIMTLFDVYDVASETAWHPRILPETSSDAVHRDTCSPLIILSSNHH